MCKQRPRCVIPSDLRPRLSALHQNFAMAQTAVDNLSTFFVVGVVEQYKGFIEVLKYSLDPGMEHPSLWKAAVGVRDNG